jgi:hypothetical protein
MSELTLAQAQAAKEAILVRAIDGQTIDLAELDAADAAVARAQRAKDLEVARAQGSKQRAEQKQIEQLRARATELETNYHDSITKLIEIAAVVDDAKAALDEALAAYYEQGKVCQAAFQAGAYHNSMWSNFHHHHNVTLRDLPTTRQPRVWNLPRDGFGVPVVKHEVFQDVAVGTINQQRIVVHALEPRVRLEFKRPIDRAA